jgi:hypothetical protein
MTSMLEWLLEMKQIDDVCVRIHNEPPKVRNVTPARLLGRSAEQVSLRLNNYFFNPRAV